MKMSRTRFMSLFIPGWAYVFSGGRRESCEGGCGGYCGVKSRGSSAGHCAGYCEYIIFMNIALRRFPHNHGIIATEENPKPGLCPTLISRMTSRVLYSAQYHRQHYTLHAFQQFVALYMHNHDDK